MLFGLLFSACGFFLGFRFICLLVFIFILSICWFRFYRTFTSFFLFWIVFIVFWIFTWFLFVILVYLSINLSQFFLIFIGLVLFCFVGEVFHWIAFHNKRLLSLVYSFDSFQHLFVIFTQLICTGLLVTLNAISKGRCCCGFGEFIIGF